MQKLLNFYADEIERTLDAHNVKLQVVGGKVNPRFIRFEAITLIGQKVADVQRREEELALALNAPSCRIARHRGRITIEVPRDDARPVLLMPLLRKFDERLPCSAILGLGEEGWPLVLDFLAPSTAHVLVAGITGCGKSELLRSITLSLAMSAPVEAMTMVLIGQQLAVFSRLPHLIQDVVASDTEAALTVLANLSCEMDTRLAAGRKQPFVVIVIDELADLLLAGGKEIGVALTRLVQRGRNAGIHVVAATQKPTAEVLGSLVKSNFPVRIVGSVASPEDAKVASGLAGTGAERLLGRGDFLVIIHGTVTRFQAAFLPRSEMRMALGRIDGAGVTAKPLEMQPGDWREWIRSRLRIVEGRGGHNRKSPTEEMIEFALHVYRESGEWPSKWAIRKRFGCNNRRAGATLERAIERLNGKMGSRIKVLRS